MKRCARPASASAKGLFKKAASKVKKKSSMTSLSPAKKETTVQQMSEVKVVVGQSVGEKMSQLNQIFQTKNLNFAFLHEQAPGEFVPFHPPCKCRDYLGDILHSKFYGKPFSIYGMTLKPEDNLLCEDRLQLLVDFPNKSMRDQFIKNFPFLNRKTAELLDGPPVSLSIDTNSEKRVVLFGDKFWQSKSYYISLLTFICRTMMYLDSPEQDFDVFEKKDLVSRGIDGNYYIMLRDAGLQKFAPLLRKIDPDNVNGPCGWDADADIASVHNYSGILTYFKAGSYKKIYGINKSKDVKRMHKLMEAAK